MSIYFKGKEIKYIASDLDGTLLYGEGHKLDDETYDLISQCVDQGILFIIASGRTYDNERVVLNPIAEKVSYIGGSGADSICPIFNDNLPNINVVTSGKNWLDFLIPNINKGSTLKVLLNKLNINQEDGIAFGDQGNDIELIQTAGIGYCMKTGVEEAKKAADYVIDTPKTVLKELLKGCN